MQLFYYRRRDRQPNFGDELNPWLWPQLLPDTFNNDNENDDETYFVGIGTLLNQQLIARTADAKRVIVFSSGVGYEQPLTAIPEHWQILCVRGPHSARQLGLPSTRAITDGGVLIRQCFHPPSGQDAVPAKRAFMPHIHHANSAQAAWESLCRQANLRYIDPRWPVEKVLTAIHQTQVLYAEAMHGAIAADALRVPWIPIVTSPRILRFKWQDWCGSIEVPYRPQVLPPLADYPRYGRGVRSGQRAFSHWLQSRQLPTHQRQDIILKRLQQLTEQTPVLSRIEILEQRTEALLQVLDHIKQENDRVSQIS